MALSLIKSLVKSKKSEVVVSGVYLCFFFFRLIKVVLVLQIKKM